MGYEVVLSERFIDDLKEVVEYYTEKAGSEVAIHFGDRLIDSALSIKRHPFAGTKVKGRPGARYTRYHAYLIFYDVDESSQNIEVLTLWHGAQDPKRLNL